MEINVNDDIKIVEIWLTRAEREDAGLRERLKPLYQKYKAKKYMVAQFESGGQALEDITGALLVYNRKRSAQMEMEREKRQGTTICDTI